MRADNCAARDGIRCFALSHSPCCLRRGRFANACAPFFRFVPVLLHLIALPQTLSLPTRFSIVPSTAAILREGMGTPAGDQCELFSQKLSQALAAPVFATFTLPEIPGLGEAVTLQVLQKIRAVAAAAAAVAAAADSTAAPAADSGDAGAEAAATLPEANERVPAAAEDEDADAVS